MKSHKRGNKRVERENNTPVVCAVRVRVLNRVRELRERERESVCGDTKLRSLLPAAMWGLCACPHKTKLALVLLTLEANYQNNRAVVLE